jgi:hypothetical protein
MKIAIQVDLNNCGTSLISRLPLSKVFGFYSFPPGLKEELLWSVSILR